MAAFFVGLNIIIVKQTGINCCIKWQKTH